MTLSMKKNKKRFAEENILFVKGDPVSDDKGKRTLILYLKSQQST
jgi:hypothetical protein